MIYTVTVKFEADRPLSEEERGWLLGSIELQIQEPQNYDGEELEYGTVVHETTLEEEGK